MTGKQAGEFGVADATQGSPIQNNQPKPKSRDPHAGDALNIREPDSFQEAILGFWKFVEHNAGAFASVIVLALVAAAAYGIWNWFGARQERAAQRDYYKVEASYTKIKEGFDRAKYKSLMPPTAAKDEKPSQPATGDLAKDYGTVPADLEKIARENAGTSAGAQAAILAADLYMTYKQPEKAISVAETAAKGMGKNTVLGGLSKMIWGSALAQKGACQDAVQVWQQVIDTSSASFLHADASLRAGLCYESLNQPDKARALYQKVTADESTAAQTAKGLLRALDMKSATPAKGQ